MRNECEIFVRKPVNIWENNIKIDFGGNNDGGCRLEKCEPELALVAGSRLHVYNLSVYVKGRAFFL
jgi:hypothetical protein